MSQIESGSGHVTPSQPPNSLPMLSYSELMMRGSASHYPSDQYQQQQWDLSPHANHSNSAYNGDCNTTYTDNVNCGAMPTSSNRFLPLLTHSRHNSGNSSNGYGTASSTGILSVISPSMLSCDQSLSDPEYSLSQVEENDQYECEEYPSPQRQDTGHSTKVVIAGLRASITRERYKSMMKTKRKMPKQTATDETSGKNTVSIFILLLYRRTDFNFRNCKCNDCLGWLAPTIIIEYLQAYFHDLFICKLWKLMKLQLP